MDVQVAGWKPLDLIVGGMLTAGLAFGVYKFGRLGRRAAGAAAVTELDASNLQECIALAGRPSELEVAVLPQPERRCRLLAASLKQSMQAGTSCSSSQCVVREGQRDDHNPQADIKNIKTFFRQLCAETKKEFRDLFDRDRVGASPDHSPPRRRHFRPDPYYSPLMVDRTPPELTRQLQLYRDTLDKWTADSEAKIEKIEQQRMSLATELHVTRETLQTERRHRAEAEQRRQRAEVQLQELEERLERCSETQGQVSRREEEVRRLEQHVQDMEEQLEMLYLHNVVTPRQAVQDNVLQQQELSHSLQQAQDDLETQQSDLQDMENEIINLSSQLNKLRKDNHQLGEDNMLMEKQLNAAHQAARHMVAVLYERSASRNDNNSELDDLLNAPDSDLPLDKLLECVTTLLVHS